MLDEELKSSSEIFSSVSSQKEAKKVPKKKKFQANANSYNHEVTAGSKKHRAKTPIRNIYYKKIGESNTNKDNTSNIVSKSGPTSSFDSVRLTHVMTQKNDLDSKVGAAIQTKRQLNKREAELQQSISILNEQSTLSMSILDEKKARLIEENDRLRSQYELYPPVNFLTEQSSILSEILNTTSNASNFGNKSLKPPPVVDVKTMKKIGVIQRSEEDLSILPERLSYLVSRYDAIHRAIKVGNNQALDSQDETDEERDLRRRIKLLKISSKSSFELIQHQCDQLQADVIRLNSEIEAITNLQKSSSKFSPRKKMDEKPFIRELRDALIEASGNIGLLGYNMKTNEYQYNGFSFIVSKVENELYATNQGDTVQLNQFIENIVNF